MPDRIYWVRGDAPFSAVEWGDEEFWYWQPDDSTVYATHDGKNWQRMQKGN